MDAISKQAAKSMQEYMQNEAKTEEKPPMPGKPPYQGKPQMPKPPMQAPK